MFGIRKARYGRRPRAERAILLLTAVIGIANALVEVLSLGYLTCDWRANFIFSDFSMRAMDES